MDINFNTNNNTNNEIERTRTRTSKSKTTNTNKKLKNTNNKKTKEQESSKNKNKKFAAVVVVTVVGDRAVRATYVWYTAVPGVCVTETSSKASSRGFDNGLTREVRHWLALGSAIVARGFDEI